MGCGGGIYNNRFDQLCFLLKEYEKNLDLIFREKIPENKKTKLLLINEERKEQIRIVLSELNDFFFNNPKNIGIKRLKKLNEKFQSLLTEESFMIKEEIEQINNNNSKDDNIGVSLLPK